MEGLCKARFRRWRFFLAVKFTGIISIICLMYFLNEKFTNSKKVNAPNETDSDLNTSRPLPWRASRPINNMLKRQRSPISCELLIKDDKKERTKAENFQNANPKIPIPDSEYIHKTHDCRKFIAENDYQISSPIPEEKDFPLAFSILVYKDVEQFERLLRSIYRPQNFYCVHVDGKSNFDLHLAIRSISSCFDNVFALEYPVAVSWGTYSALKPDILCMEALLKYKKWKYFINLTGQEFPLKTNWELVQILKAIKGANLVAATRSQANRVRFRGRPPPPIPVTVYKGSVHAVVRREFVEYVVNDEDCKKYLDWLKLVGFPDEYLFSTLNHNPQLKIPGSYLGIPETRIASYNYPFINRYKIWRDWKGYVCSGKFVRTVCVFGVGDLPRLAKSKFLFANKFHLNYQPLALDCLEELMYNRTLAELRGGRHIDLSFYSGLQVTKRHI